MVMVGEDGSDDDLAAGGEERAGESEPKAASEAETESETASETETEAETEASTAVPLLALDAGSLITWFTSILAGRAWVDMGLLADPIKGEVTKNMESARLAIDAYDGLLGCLRKRDAEAHTLRQLDAVLTDLRLNFVRQAGGG